MTNKFAVAMLIWMSAASWALADESLGGRRDAPLVVCADAYNFPASMKDLDPPGYDVEIIRAIAKLAATGVEYVWPDTGTRGGLGRALRNSILQKKCNVFVGLGMSSETVEEMKEKHLTFTQPYMSEGYVLIEKENAVGKTKLSDFREVKIGVAMSTPADAYLFDNGYKRSIFVRDRLIFKALDTGEINVALVWSPALAYARKDFSSMPFRVSNQMPEADLRWNVSMAVPEGDAALKALLDKAINELLQNGEIKRIVERYGVPFYPPMNREGE
jgi:polar amino acid transport system substrate-binding protein